MNLTDALRQIAVDFNLNAQDLIAYAGEDTESGWDYGHGNWRVGSLFREEGQVLYALVRALKPQRVLEIGVCTGCSATHLMMALERNGSGTMTSIDVDPGAGKQISDHFRPQWEFIRADALTWLETTARQFDFVFEDSVHSYEFTKPVLELARARGAKVILSHDATHRDTGTAVSQAVLEALGSLYTVTIDPSDCGMALWMRNGK